MHTVESIPRRDDDVVVRDTATAMITAQRARDDLADRIRREEREALGDMVGGVLPPWHPINQLKGELLQRQRDVATTERAHVAAVQQATARSQAAIARQAQPIVAAVQRIVEEELIPEVVAYEELQRLTEEQGGKLPDLGTMMTVNNLRSVLREIARTFGP